MQVTPKNSTNGLSVLYNLLQEWVYRLGRPVRDVLLYSSAYLAFIAAAEVLIVTELLSLPLTPAPVIAGLLSFAVYGNDRVADVEFDEKTAPARTAFVRRHQRHLYTLSALTYGLAVALAILGGPVAFALALLPGAIWVVYALDWLPISGHVNRLKQIFVLNSVLVAGAWALVVVLLPIAFAGAPVTLTAGVVCLTFFLATFVDVEIPNVRDRASDREAGVKTLPVVFGIRGTRYALYGVTSLAAALLVTASSDGLLTRPETVLLLLCVGYLTVIVTCLGRVDDSGKLTVAAECSRLPMLALLFPPLL